MTITSWRRDLFICLSLAVAIAAVYSPVRHLRFVDYDDDMYVTANAYVQAGVTLRGFIWAFTTRHFDNWHPLTWLSHMLDCQLFGVNAAAHHLVSVLIHAANAVLLFIILNRMTAAPWRSAFVAALFGLHPLHVESVAWIAERKDVLSTLFWTLTVWTYVGYVEEPTLPRYLITLILFALALMAKPMVVTLPFVLVLLDVWPLGRTPWIPAAVSGKAKSSFRRLVMEKVPFFALAATSCVVTFWAQYTGGEVYPLEHLPLGVRAGNAVLSYVRYAAKMVWPKELAIFYPMPEELSAATVIAAGAGLLGITVVVIWRARRAPWLVTGWFWYLGTLVPVIGLVQVGAQAMADRYTYVSLVGLFLMLCWSVPGRTMERPTVGKVACVTAGVVLALCAVLSRRQIEYWKDNITLFSHALDVTTNNWLAHNNLGVALGRAGNTEDAIRHLEQALRIRPDYAEAHGNLGNALLKAGNFEAAINHYEQALRIKPEYAEGHYNLGNALLQAGRLQEAVEQYEQALRIKSDYAEAHNHLGNALSKLGRVQEAIGHYRQSLWIRPDYAGAHYNLGVALERVGRLQEAIEHYEQALRLKPDYAEARNRLARLRSAQ